MEFESSYVPPGFRFHPTDEELVGYYLKRKVESLKLDLDVIVDIDLYRMEPWDIEGKCKLGYEEQNEWFFFSYKDRKYPTGTRTNRATAAGFWKATGRDKAVVSKNRIIGMRKTLVFYNGRAPDGRKSDWIIHEYRLQSSHSPLQEEGWVVCRAFKKPNTVQNHAWNNGYYVRNTHKFTPVLPNNLTINPLLSSPHSHQSTNSHHQIPICDPEQLLVEPSEIYTPSTSKNFAINEDLDFDNNGNAFNQYDNDWKNVEYLIDSHLDKVDTFLDSTIPLIMHNNDDVKLDSCPQMSHLFGCFSEF